MISHRLEGWEMAELDLLVIENVGNLVCPTGYDLREDTPWHWSVSPRGEDRPLKYPRRCSSSADVVVVTKTDIADAVRMGPRRCLSTIQTIAPEATVSRDIRTHRGRRARFAGSSARPGDSGSHHPSNWEAT